MSYLNECGYVRTYIRNHPVASSNGTLYAHRAVLFDEIGLGPHQCTLCRAHINWGAGLQADHIDKNRANNTLENLRPVCKPCNLATRVFTKRGHAQAA